MINWQPDGEQRIPLPPCPNEDVVLAIEFIGDLAPRPRASLVAGSLPMIGSGDARIYYDAPRRDLTVVWVKTSSTYTTQSEDGGCGRAHTAHCTVTSAAWVSRSQALADIDIAMRRAEEMDACRKHAKQVAEQRREDIAAQRDPIIAAAPQAARDLISVLIDEPPDDDGLTLELLQGYVRGALCLRDVEEILAWGNDQGYISWSLE